METSGTTFSKLKLNGIITKRLAEKISQTQLLMEFSGLNQTFILLQQKFGTQRFELQQIDKG